jgi:hypothetical protein
MQYLKQIFKKTSVRQNVEFGQVLVLITVLLTLYHKNYQYAVVSACGILLTLLVPVVFYPFAVIWFGLSNILSRISSFVLLNLLFFLFVVPVGFIRKWMGKDSLKMKQFKRGRQSVMTTRNHVYEAADLINTF